MKLVIKKKPGTGVHFAGLLPEDIFLYEGDVFVKLKQKETSLGLMPAENAFNLSKARLVNIGCLTCVTRICATLTYEIT